MFRFIYLIVLWFWAGAAWALSYEAPLPPKLFSDPQMCQHVDCRDVLPAAETFSPRKGRPPYVEGYKTVNGEKVLVGYVYLSTDVSDIPAYSGKPIVTLVGMDETGVISGMRILKHSEPILLVGIPEQKLLDYVEQYLHHPAGTRFELGKAEGDYVPMTAISGATVTLIAQNQLISRTSYEIAKQAGIVKAVPKPPARFIDLGKPLDWDALLQQGSVQRLTVKPSQVGEPDTGKPYIDLYFGYLNHPTAGKSVLGESAYAQLMQRLGPDEHAIFIIANGEASFKGSGFVRGGMYDRVQLKQDRDTFTFRDTDYLNLYAVNAAGAPSYTESAIFIVRSKQGFSAAYPWSLAFLGNTLDKDTGQRTFANFEQEYWLPAAWLEGGRPSVTHADPAWLKAWKGKKIEIAVFVGFLLLVAGFYALRDRWERRAKRGDKRIIKWPRTVFWLFSVGFVGFWQLAQPSVTQLLTLIHGVFGEWRWSLFLSDPLIFLFWVFIAVTLVLWGRGLFCGWLCPYGSLSELLFNLGGKIGLKRFQFSLPMVWHHRLKWLKYAIFVGLVGVSFYSMGLAEQLAEVEPFKTTFLVGVWNRSWPFVLFWGVLAVWSLLSDRPFCKYLCPLGAGLAIPAKLRRFGLKRKAECNHCKACAVGCGAHAIDPQGRIDPQECMLCLDCMVLYYDDHACPPLAQERKRRQKAGEPLTPIGADGYFIPIKEIKSETGEFNPQTAKE